MYLSLLTLKCLSTEKKKDTDCLVDCKLKVPQGVVHKLSPLFSDDTSFRLLWLVCSFKHQLNYEI